MHGEGLVLGKKILLAEESELISAMENSFLRRGGFSFLTAADGEQAFAMIEEEDPALVLLGLDMDGMEGDRCCRRVKEDPFLRPTPIVLLSYPDRQEDLARCRDAGCDEIVFRPIDPNHLITTASLLLNIVDRAAPRIVTHIPVQCGPLRSKSRSGQILNLNAGGLFLAADRFFPVDTLLDLTFSLPGCRFPLHGRGRVAWVNHPEWIKAPELPPGMGVEFFELDLETSEAVRNFVEKQGGGNS